MKKTPSKEVVSLQILDDEQEVIEALESVNGYIGPAASILEVPATALHDKIRKTETLKAFVKDFNDKYLLCRQPKKSKTSLRKEQALDLARMYLCKKSSVCSAMKLNPTALSNWFVRDDDFKSRWDEVYESVGDSLEGVLEGKALHDSDAKSAYTILRARYPERGYRPDLKPTVTVNVAHEDILSALSKDKP